MVHKLKRAYGGTAVLTMQIEIEAEDVEEVLEGIEAKGLSDWFAHTEPKVALAFLERGAQRGVVRDLLGGGEVEGPAELRFEEVLVEQAVTGLRNARFDERPWFEQDVGDEARHDRFAPLEAK